MDSVRERVGVYCARTGASKKQLADALNMPYTTFLSKLNGPSEFSFSEGLALARAIKITATELATPVDSTDVCFSRSEYSDHNPSSSQNEEEEPAGSSL